jgi:hypothetical protein
MNIAPGNMHGDFLFSFEYQAARASDDRFNRN